MSHRGQQGMCTQESLLVDGSALALVTFWSTDATWLHFWMPFARQVQFSPLPNFTSDPCPIKVSNAQPFSCQDTVLWMQSTVHRMLPLQFGEYIPQSYRYLRGVGRSTRPACTFSMTIASHNPGSASTGSKWGASLSPAKYLCTMMPSE